MPSTVDAFYSYETWNSVLRILGLSCVYRDGVELKTSWSSVKIVSILLLLMLLNALNLFFKIQFFGVATKMDFIDIFQMGFLFNYFQYILDLYYVYKFGRDTFLKYFQIYNDIDRCLIMTSYSVMKRSILYLVVKFIIIIIIILVFDYIVWIHAIGWEQPTLYIVEYFYLILRMLNVFDIMVNIIQVEFRMKGMADILEDFYESSSSLPGLNECLNKKGTIPTRQAYNLNRSNLLKTVYLNRENSILKLNRCYLLLLEQTDFINNMYGFRTLMTCMSFLIETILNLNLLIRIILGCMELTIQISVWYIALAITVRFAASGSLLFGKVFCAEHINTLLRKIVRLVDLILVNKELRYEVRDSLKELRGLVTSRPAEFHAIHFFKLNYRFLLAITSVVITYTLLLLQYIK